MVSMNLNICRKEYKNILDVDWKAKYVFLHNLSRLLEKEVKYKNIFSDDI
jgi:hypothetical protein